MPETRLNRVNRPYELCEYDPVWAVRFSELKGRVASLFGDNLVLFEHIGSTSIQGMLAKPVIDVLVVVKDLAIVSYEKDRLISAGFESKGDYVGQNEEYFTNTTPGGKREINMHVMQEGNPAIDNYLVFRDFLRSDAKAREQYINEKKRLKELFGSDDYNSYDFGKEASVINLRDLAWQWRLAQTILNEKN